MSRFALYLRQYIRSDREGREWENTRDKTKETKLRPEPNEQTSYRLSNQAHHNQFLNLNDKVKTTLEMTYSLTENAENKESQKHIFKDSLSRNRPKDTWRENVET